MVETKGENLRARTRPRLISHQTEANKPARRHAGHIMLLEARSLFLDLYSITLVYSMALRGMPRSLADYQ